ncbi:MAG TPA: exo-beta-N-acetylmuramidase NamZ domain-containing protein, partial [Thermoanaerobaculia bacterium]|nr:exo-beta-N-acetylmuramidase NamZ domain-containing protein [Thermoanaerobaculia bacterium]
MSGVRLGIDRLLTDPSPVDGKRFGLITNPSGVTSDGAPSWRALAALRAGKLTRLFGPEHGVEGGAIYMESVGDAVHPPSGLPTVSLYGHSIASLKPKRQDLEGLDALVFDVADVGSRYYTYIWTMMLAMEAAAEAGIRFVVCDRPNPIGGAVEGAPQEPEFLSFV